YPTLTLLTRRRPAPEPLFGAAYRTDRRVTPTPTRPTVGVGQLLYLWRPKPSMVVSASLIRHNNPYEEDHAHRRSLARASQARLWSGDRHRDRSPGARGIDPSRRASAFARAPRHGASRA